MINLDTTAKSLEVLLGAGIATTQPNWTTSYVDINQGTIKLNGMGASDGVANGAVAVTIVDAPAAGNTREIKNIAIHNTDTISQTIIVQLNNGGSIRRIISKLVASGDTLVYDEANGWQIACNNSQGAAGAPGAAGQAGPAIFLDYDTTDEPFSMPGQAGRDGNNGTTGAQGPMGPTFIPEDGVDGMDGFPGTTGSAGATGATGPAGPAGMGLDGIDGEEGMPIPGPAGVAGAAGATGAQGPVGPIFIPEDGSDGLDGFPGVTGASGSAGIQGPQGPVGVTIDGIDGEMGMPIPGNTGPQGAVGPQGPIGPIFIPEDGLDGNDGFPGIPGPAGANGTNGSGGGNTVYVLDRDTDIADEVIVPHTPPTQRVYYGTATVDFTGDNLAQTTVITPFSFPDTAIIQAWIFPILTADHSEDEQILEPIRVVAFGVSNTSFTISAIGMNPSEPLEYMGDVKVRPPTSTEAAVYTVYLPSVGGKSVNPWGEYTVAWSVTF